jgi:spermidine synthase
MDRINNRYPDFFIGSLICFPITLGIGFIIYCKTPFNPFEVGIDPVQIIYLLIYFAAMAVPFFFSAGVIGLALQKYPIGKTYFLNLAGSGVGAIFVIVLSYLFHPFDILLAVTILAVISSIIFSTNFSKKFISIITVSGLTFIALFYLSFDIFNLKQTSEYKPLSRTLLLPNSGIIMEKFSPLGLVQAVEADGLRFSGDLSMMTPYHIPEQKALFFDGDAMSAVIPFDGNLDKHRYLDYTPSSIAAHILSTNHRDYKLIIGAGGGSSIVSGLFYGFNHIHALELNPDVISIMQNEFRKYSGDIYNNPRVTVFPKEHRGFLVSSTNRYSLIEVAMTDSFAGTASGIYALNESYLYTLESFSMLFDALDKNGILAVTRWNVTPPRDNVKMINLAVATLKNAGLETPSKHIFIIRSMRASVIVLSKSPISETQIQKGRNFAKNRGFDLVYHYDISPDEVNRFIRIPEPVYYKATVAFLSDNPGFFINRYLFDINVPTDNRPYFHNFFKRATLPYLTGEQSLPFTEWGLFVLILFFIPTLVLSFALIILPLILSPIKTKGLPLPTFLYFSLIGIGFFFIEMPFIQRFILFLHHPTYSLSVIISGLLIFSGIGSFLSDRVFNPKRRIFFASLCLVGVLILYQIILPPILRTFSSHTDIVRIIITLILLFPMGFFMGFFFPQGLNAVKSTNSRAMPWAWCINGFFSVISVMLANMLAIYAGFSIVLYVAIGCYILAGVLSIRLVKAIRA